MRILLDLQGAQTESRYRGIGRYSMSLAQALARVAGPHRVGVLLNSALPDMDTVRAAFAGLIERDAMHAFETAGPTAECDATNYTRARASERMREAVIADLAPDLVHVSSLFEGWGDDAVTSIGALPPSPLAAATLYDVIPLVNPGEYLADPGYRDYYFRKLCSLKRADLLLAISENARHEAMAALGLRSDRVAVIGGGVDPLFAPGEESPGMRESLHRRLGVDRAYVLYVGGFDARKNLHRLLAAYAAVPQPLRTGRQLLIAGRLPGGAEELLRNVARRHGLARHDLLFTGHLSEGELITIYRGAELFVFPSLHEGFGLPPLEAMACGAPVIGSATSCIPEVIGRPDALFDPTDVNSIAAKLAEALSDPAFRDSLRAHGLAQSRKFTWEEVARKALAAFVEHVERTGCRRAQVPVDEPRRRLAVVLDAPMDAQRDFDLLVEITRRHDVVVVTVDSGIPLHEWVSVNFPPHNFAWLDVNAHRIDRILYVTTLGSASRALREAVARRPGTIAVREATPHAGPPQNDRTATEVAQSVYRTHGFAGQVRLQQDAVADDVTDMSDLLEHALGLIVPSRALFDRLRDVLGEASAGLVAIAPGVQAEVAAHWCAAMYRFETQGPRSRESRLIDAIAEAAAGEPALTPADLERCAIGIAAHRPRLGQPRLYLDISELAQRDARTGIQRVVRGVLAELLHKPPSGYRVEPVREDGRGRYTYARPQALRMLGLPSDWLREDPVEAREGDVFLGLDLFADGIARVEGQLSQWRARGVRLHFVVYDLLPINLPGMFAPELVPVFDAWLGLLSLFADGIVCISRAVADDYLAWIAKHPPARTTPIAVGHFPLGASFADTHPTRGLPANAKAALARLTTRPSFLMVGTVEPRKAHPQALAAFEQLWQRGVDANLVIVGKEGWMMAAFAQCLRSHPEMGRRLFWFEGVSDEMLERVYQASTVLLCTSLGEGFGLPLVEAAHRGLPLIARELPVFREVAGDKAYYYSGEDPTNLARAVETWLGLWRAGTAPGSRGIRSLSWAESAGRLMDVVLGGTRYAQWHPGNRTTFTPPPATVPAQSEPAVAKVYARPP